MYRKGVLCFAALILVFALAVSNAAGGLFPDADEMFGVSLPSVGLAIGKAASEQSDTDAGYQETYTGFSMADYFTVGQYLAGVGAKIVDYKIDGSSIIATITARDSSMTFSYDWAEQIAIVLYPAGSRAETELQTTEPDESILPPIGGIMPSAEFAIGRKPDEQVMDDGKQILNWNEFRDEDYAAFSAYLGEAGAELKDSAINAGVLNAEIGLNGFAFSFVYDWNEQTAQLIYPDGTAPETNRWNSPAGNGSILPEISSMGKELPRISAALEREPSSSETLQDGVILETYLDFSEADYSTFSQYLQKMNCALDDYHAEEDGTMVIHLSNGSGKMTFSYDAVRHIGTVEYPNHTRVEKAWAATPVPTQKAESTPEPKKNVTYTVDDLWRIARKYFYNLRWKNPNSVTIHDYTWDLRDGGIVFQIDYSAENGFGGTNRSYYWVTVDPDTCEVIRAFGTD